MRIIDDYHIVKLPKKKKGKVQKRSGIAPNPAELNVYDKLYSPQSYDNYGHPQPYGTEGVFTQQCANASNGSQSCGEDLSLPTLKLKLAECWLDNNE